MNDIIMRLTLTLFVLSAALFISACNSTETDPRIPGKDTIVVDAAHPRFPQRKHNPEFRSQVAQKPVAEFRKPTGRPEGDFHVALYQTAKTMAYRVEMEFEGLPGTDTVKFPDLGTEPHPVLKNGSDDFSCIIGFLDNDKQFRELKLVRANGNNLKISTLRHWVVTDHFRLVSQ